MKRIFILVMLLSSLASFSQINVAEGAGPSQNGSSSTNIATGSITWTANHLYFLFVTEKFSSSDPGTPTATAAGMTWNVLDSKRFSTIASPLSRTTIFYCMPASTVTVAVTIAHASGTGEIGYVMQGMTGAQTGSNGTNAIVQWAVNSGDASTNATVNLPNPMDGTGQDAGFLFFGVNSTTSNIGTGESGWTEFVDAAFGNNAMIGYRRTTTTDNTGQATISSAKDWGGIMVEVRAAKNRRIVSDY